MSDFYDLTGAAKALELLRQRRHQVVCLQVLDRLEFDPEQLSMRGDVTIVDAESKSRSDVTVTDGMLQNFHVAHEQFCQALSTRCRSQGIPYFRIDARDDLPEVVLRVLRSGGVLR